MPLSDTRIAPRPPSIERVCGGSFYAVSRDNRDPALPIDHDPTYFHASVFCAANSARNVRLPEGALALSHFPSLSVEYLFLWTISQPAVCHVRTLRPLCTVHDDSIGRPRIR